MPIDEALKKFATTRQAEIIDAVIKCGSNQKASHFLNVNRTTVDRAIKAVNKKCKESLKPKVETTQRKHFVIPDVQAKPGHDFSYLRAAGNYIVEKRPDVIVCIGDFADMESLSTYDRGLKSFEGRSYNKDIWAAREAMDALLEPLFALWKREGKKYNPSMVLTLGNHEHRIDRAVNEDRKLDGLISTDDLPYQDWEVIPFLEVIVIDGVAYSHYFTSGVMGRPITTANALLAKKHMSCFAGHQQGRQIAYARRADGKEMTAIICGSFYEHDEDYLGNQGNQHFRGCYMLHEVDDGAFDEMAVSLRYLKANYL
jgi:hypothetical protein